MADDSQGSPLSSHDSSEFEGSNVGSREASLEPDRTTMPSSKRQKITTTSFKPLENDPYYNDDIDVSSDSSGDVPPDPNGLPGLTEEDHQEQVTICRWRACTRGDCGNMDGLVEHIHEAHIPPRQKKYVCEWEGCSRLDANHASAYALRAHMKSHTREKPFFCLLPECDRSFTRSDALAKHMRTVHETEALRPSDPVPKSQQQAQGKNPRLKLIVNKPGAGNKEADGEEADDDDLEMPDYLQETEAERQMSPEQLFRLLRRKVHWSSQEQDRLKKECEYLEKLHKDEWVQTQLVLNNYIEAELATAHQNAKSQEDIDAIAKIKEELLPETMLPMTGETPWYRQADPAQALKDQMAKQKGEKGST